MASMGTRRFAVEYIDSLLARSDESAQAELIAVMTSWSGYDRSQHLCGVTQALLAYVETNCWMAQSFRSGAWSYYEATPEFIQRDVRDALRRLGRADFSEIYEEGMRECNRASHASHVDAWLTQNEQLLRRWLKTLAEAHRADILTIS
jgi:hypothetical protein